MSQRLKRNHRLRLLQTTALLVSGVILAASSISIGQEGGGGSENGVSSGTATPTTTTTKPSSKTKMEQKMIKKIQEITTSSTSTLLDVPTAQNPIVTTKICPASTVQYQSVLNGNILNLHNDQRFVGENVSHNVCFVENGFTVAGMNPPVRAPETTTSVEQVAQYITRYHTFVRYYAYALNLGGLVYYACYEDTDSKTPKWTMIRGCEVVISEFSTVHHTYYDVDSTPAPVSSGPDGGGGGGDGGGGDGGDGADGGGGK